MIVCFQDNLGEHSHGSGRDMPRTDSDTAGKPLNPVPGFIEEVISTKM